MKDPVSSDPLYIVSSIPSTYVRSTSLQSTRRGRKEGNAVHEIRFEIFFFHGARDTPVEWRRLICEQVPYRPVNSPYKLATRPRSEIKRYTRALSGSDRPFFEQVNVHEIKISAAEAARLNRSHLYKSLIPETSTTIYVDSLRNVSAILLHIAPVRGFRNSR